MSDGAVQQKQFWSQISVKFLPFADAATEDLPLSRLLRLSLFQISVGMAMAMTFGTLNRVMIVELGTSATLVSVMVALPLLFAPFRALIGFRSDTHRSAFGWRRVPYIWFGTLLQFGGLAIMPFALIVLTGDGGAPVNVGIAAAALAFLLIGAGVHSTQTAGLALAGDLAKPDTRPRVVALMYVMLLVGLFFSSLLFGVLLVDFTPLRLIQVIQGAAVVTLAINSFALWKQEPRRTTDPGKLETPKAFGDTWRAFLANNDAKRFLIAVGVGTAAFSMQDILLEPYGGEVIGLSVASTTLLTALFSAGAIVSFGAAAHLLSRGWDPYRLAGYAALIGVPGFAIVMLAAPIDSPFLFRIGTIVIGFGSGLFSVSTLAAAMRLAVQGQNGLALGAWGAVQATMAGIAMGLGGATRDLVSGLAGTGVLGSTLQSSSTGYVAVYGIELLLLFATLIAIGPLARLAQARGSTPSKKFGLARLPS